MLTEPEHVSLSEPRMTSSAAARLDTRALEALFFVSDEPLTASVLAQALDLDRRTVDGLCDRLANELEERGSGVVLRNVAGGWRLYTHPDARRWSNSSSCPRGRRA